MLRAKRRRTRMHDSKGNPIFNTNNATSKQIKKCEICEIPKKPMNDVYKDNYAKTCGRFRKEDVKQNKNCAYKNVILPEQNKNGIVDANYNYTTNQYFSRESFVKCNNIYKKSNTRFSTQGAVSGGSRINRLKYQTLVKSQQKESKIYYDNINTYKFNVGLWQHAGQLKLYGYRNGTGIPGSLSPDNLQGNTIVKVNFTENNFLNTYGLQIYFASELKYKFNQNILDTLKFVFISNNINVIIPFSDVTQFYNYGVNVEYIFDYKNTHPNYNLIKNIIDNGNIVGKTIDFIIEYRAIKRISSNKVNGQYPISLYKDTYPTYKKNLFGLVKCNARTKNGLLQNCKIPK